MRHAVLLLGLGLLACGGGDGSPGAREPDVEEIVPAPDQGCAERRAAARQAVEAARTAQLACVHDGDCTLADTSTGCEWTCPAPVSRRGEPAMAAEVHAADVRHCQGYREAGCRVGTATCLSVVAVCIEGQCAALREPLCRLDCSERGL